MHVCQDPQAPGASRISTTPTAVAETVKQPEQSGAAQKKKRGAASLVLRRPTMGGLGTASSTGVNTSNY